MEVKKHPLVEVYHSEMTDEAWDLFIIPICPYCLDTHTHGADKIQNLKKGEQGWKGPHCSQRNETLLDYRIVWLGKIWPKQKADRKRIIDDLKSRGLTSKIGECD